MKWKFCRVQQSDYYFGEVSITHQSINKNTIRAHGIGIYFRNLKEHFYGQWEDGNLKVIYVQEKNSPTTKENFPADNLEMIYDKFRVFTEYYELFWVSEKNELYHNEMMADVNKYSVRNFQIFDLRLIFKVLNTIHCMFKYKKKSYAIFTYFMLVNSKTEHLEFQLVTDLVYNPWDLIRNSSSVEQRMHFYEQLVTFVKQLHQDNICHDDIHPKNIRATCNEKNQHFLSFYDFSRAKMLNQQEVKEGCKIKSLFTRSISFRAPETFQNQEYNGKASDCFSLALMLYAFELNDQNIGATASEGLASFVDEHISSHFKSNQRIYNIFTQMFISKVLGNNTSGRPEIDKFVISATTT